MISLSVRLKSIYWKSLREVEDLKVDIKSKDGINLLQIQNSYGKTTTLKLLRCIFSGDLMPEEQWKSYKYKKLFGGQSDKSEFFVDLDINNKEYTIGIEFDHLNNTAEFITISPEIGGRKKGWYPPSIFQSKFLKKNSLVKLFIFNGEMAKELNETQGAEIIEDSLRQITNLHILYNFVSDDGDLQNIINTILKEKEVKTVDRAYKQYMAFLKTCRDHIKYLENQAHLTEYDIGEKKEELKKNLKEQDEIDKKNKELGPEIDKIKDKRQKVKERLNEQTTDLLDAFFNPANIPGNIWDEVKKYHESFEKKKIPRSVGQQFILELLEGDNCICGNNWTESMKQFTKKNIELFLGDELLTTIKSMQGSVRESNKEKNIEKLTEGIRESKNLINEYKLQIQTIRKQFDEEAAKRLTDLQNLAAGIRVDIDTMEEMLNEITEKNEVKIDERGWRKEIVNVDKSISINPLKFKDCNNIKCLRIVENAILEQLSEFANVKQLNLGIEIVSEVITDTLNKIMGVLRNSVMTNANQLLKGMRATGGGLQLRSIHHGLEFVNEMGESQDTANTAAELCGAYCYVTAMYKFGEIEVPLIVDSPASGFGAGVADDWAIEIPYQFPQVIAFITSLEKAGLLDLVENSKKETSVCTIRRKEEKINGKPQSGIMICDTDREFYMNYEMEKVIKILTKEGN